MGDSAGARLAEFRATLGLNQRDFAASLGTSHGTVAFIESDQRTPSKAFLVKISDVYGVSADWLLHGHGEMLRPRGPGFTARRLRIDPPDSARPGYGDLSIGGQDYAMVRRMGLSVSAGSGLESLPEGDEDGLIFPIAWLSRRGIDPGLSVIVSVRGDSMAPAIPDGALVMIDCRVRTVQGAGVYAYVRDGQSYIKRLVPSGRGRGDKPTALMIVSDNPAYPPVALTGPDMNALSVVGKVRATITMMGD